MNETDTRANLVDPALAEAGWSGHNVTREFPIGSFRADYVLRQGGRIVGVVEAKAVGRPAQDGLMQAQVYAAMLGAPYAFASNGHTIIQADLRQGTVRKLKRFLSPAELEHGIGVPAPKPRPPMPTPSPSAPHGRRWQEKHQVPNRTYWDRARHNALSWDTVPGLWVPATWYNSPKNDRRFWWIALAAIIGVYPLIGLIITWWPS